MEVDLESTKENTTDNLQQALSVDKERYTQIQWDMEELRKKCLEMEMKLKAEQVIFVNLLQAILYATKNC